MISFFIPLIPKAQKRSRSRAIKTKSGNWTAMNYKDKGQELEEDKLIAMLLDYKLESPWEGPVALNVIAYLPMPKSKSKKWQYAAVSREILPTKKPDLDNLLKHLKDCMKGIFYQDDKQIVAIQAFKYYGGLPGWDIQIGEI